MGGPYRISGSVACDQVDVEEHDISRGQLVDIVAVVIELVATAHVRIAGEGILGVLHSLFYGACDIYAGYRTLAGDLVDTDVASQVDG